MQVRPVPLEIAVRVSGDKFAAAVQQFGDLPVIGDAELAVVLRKESASPGKYLKYNMLQNQFVI